MTPAQILTRAAELIEQGWCRHRDSAVHPVTGLRCYCVIGAVRAAGALHEDSRVRAFEFLCPAVNWHRLAPWNDAPERTKEEVVAALRAAAELATKEEVLP